MARSTANFAISTPSPWPLNAGSVTEVLISRGSVRGFPSGVREPPQGPLVEHSQLDTGLRAMRLQVVDQLRHPPARPRQGGACDASTAAFADGLRRSSERLCHE